MPAPLGVQVRWTPVPAGSPRREVAWELLRTLLPGTAARITNECARCGGPHGRVRIDGAAVQAGVTYAGGYAIVCVVSEVDAESVGIDAEPERSDRRDAAGLAGIVRPGETSSVREWTRIEAVLKADGRGLRVDPAAVGVTEAADGLWSAVVADSPRQYEGSDVAGPPGVVVSIAVEPLSAAGARERGADPAMP